MSLLVIALSTAACTAQAPPSLGSFENTPELVPFDGPVRKELTLRHESGFEYRAVIDEGGLRTPVLWDGAWEVWDGTDRKGSFTVGTAPSPPSSPDRSAFDVCLADSTEARVRPEVVNCLQSAALDGRSRPYGDVHRELDDALRRLDTTAANGLRDWYCFLAGEMIAAAAVLDGQDATAMLSGFSSHCSFSLIHGVYMAKVAPGVDLTKVCDHQSRYALAEIDHVSQCWNGIGIGLARLHRFDAERIYESCLAAPEAGARKNCFEGALNHFYNYRFRLPTGTWGPPVIDAAWCGSRGIELVASQEFQEVCYRVAVRGLLEATDPPMAPAEKFVRSCDGLAGPAREGCMVAAGSLAARLIIDYRRSIEVVESAVTICDIPEASTSGGEEVFDQPCLLRLFSGLVETPQSPYGFPVDELLVKVPEAHRRAVAEHFERWFSAIATVGES